MMTAQEVYKQFGTPSNLQNHMLSVTSLICEIRNHWAGEPIDWNSLITAGLLHDLGNVIKFDLEKFPQLLGDELPRIEFWRKEQQKLIKKYGNDDHEATRKMLDELGVSENIKNIIHAKSFGNILKTAKSNDWLPKILQYCDLRVSPYGLMTLEERTVDIKERYKKYTDRPYFDAMISAAKSIEDQIQKLVNVPLDEIVTDANITKYNTELINYSFS